MQTKVMQVFPTMQKAKSLLILMRVCLVNLPKMLALVDLILPLRNRLTIPTVVQVNPRSLVMMVPIAAHR